MLRQVIFAFFLVLGQALAANSYLNFCDLLSFGYTSEGFVIAAECGDSNIPGCQELNIGHCFANSHGRLVAAGNGTGGFETSCTGCTLDTSKSHTSTYGTLTCQCLYSAANHTVAITSIKTDNLISFDANLGMLCGTENGMSIQSTECPQASGRRANHVRERQIRHSLRGLPAWRGV
ncbi:hypothetical protein PG985_012031 [Apiospora marii]|uniref:Cyanovirin-N domain-containing protein n=1 Tax=Apiospora marii TaxID=335849 RepID=A0ABR1REG4_9PEZI